MKGSWLNKNLELVCSMIRADVSWVIVLVSKLSNLWEPLPPHTSQLEHLEYLDGHVVCIKLYVNTGYSTKVPVLSLY